MVHHHLDYGPKAIPLPGSVHSRQPGWVYGIQNMRVNKMILSTIDDVRQCTEELSRRFPSISSEISLVAESGGLSKEVTTRLKLPQEYASFAEKNKLVGISIGPFALWPSFSQKSLDQSLIEENSADSIIKKFGEDSMIAVARYEANPICIASSASRTSGNVFLLDTMSSPKWRLIHIANSFEQFLVLAANVYRVADTFEGDIKGGLGEMVKCCELLKCTPEQATYWKSRAAEML